MKKTIILIGISLLINNLYGDFDFGGSDDGCKGGNGNFEQAIESWDNDPEKTIIVGTIPKDLKDIYISLKSDKDVDIRLYDENGTKIVHWPNGILFDYKKATTTYNGVTIEYSGYNGDGTGLGHEYIKITGITQNNFIMKAFGYKAGYAKVNYSWAGKINCSTLNTSGDGNFEQKIVKDDIVVVGDIPPKINNLYITLQSDKDVDIQLYDKDTGKAIIKWANNPDEVGLLNKANKQSTIYNNMQIEWSGYDGDGTGKGHEYIKLTGETTCNLTMKAYGYESGYAKVNYKWGEDINTTNSEGNSTIDTLINRHNHYRNLDFVDSNLTWDSTLATHAQLWANYLATNYTQSDANNGISPHASQFNSTTHGLPYEGEGENIAWASSNLYYVLDNPVDITTAGSASDYSANNNKFGAVDMWANEKSYYDYSNNTGNGHVVGHYTQLVWQKSMKVGCGQAISTTDYPGSHIVCRYSPAGNIGSEKPYCTEYSIAQYYNDNSLVFTLDIINSKTFVNIKLIEDRVNCTIIEKTTETLTFNNDGSGTFQQFDFFNNNGYVVDFVFTSVIENGIIKMSGDVKGNPAIMNLKLVGQNTNYYYVEAEWSLNKDNLGYYRKGIFKLAK
jgi:pathogenesis-related protein 1